MSKLIRTLLILTFPAVFLSILLKTLILRPFIKALDETIDLFLEIWNNL
jgi:hypothetical protein